MIEYLLVTYTFTGLIKALLITLGIELPIDFTLLIGLLLVSSTLFHFFKENTISLDFFRQKNRKEKITIVSAILFYCLILLSISFNNPEKLDYPDKKAFYFLANLVPLFSVFLLPHIALHKFTRYFLAYSLFFSLFYFIASPNSKYYFPDRNFILDYSNLKTIGLTIGLKSGIAAILMFSIKKKKNWWLSLFIFFLFITFHTASRGSFIFLLLVLIFYFLTQRKQIIRYFRSLKKSFIKKSLGILGVTLILISSLIVTNEYRYDTIRRASVRMGILINYASSVFLSSDEINTQENASKNTSNEEKDEKNTTDVHQDDDAKDNNKSVNYRLEQIKWVINKLGNKDYFLFGIGFGTYGYYCCNEDGRSNYPHNIFLEAFIELGVLGFILMTTIIVIAFLSWKEKKNDFTLFVYGCVFLFFFLNMQKSFSLVDIREFFMLSSILIFIEQYKFPQKKRKKKT